MAEPTDIIERDRYLVGWNDIVHGLENWANLEDSKRLNSPAQWAINAKEIATTATITFPGMYFQGVIDCATQYLETGSVQHRPRPTLEEMQAYYKETLGRS